MSIYLGKFKNLQKLDLSFNLIKQLPEPEAFENMVSLKILYLHDNLLGQWKDLNCLTFAPALIHLTLLRNPISQVVGYRHQLVNQMKNLRALDDYIVTDEELLDYSSPNAIRFRALSQQYMKIYLPKFMENQPADQHLFNLEVDIYRIRRLYERNSPSIRIQALWRGYYFRSKAIFSYSQKKKAAIKIQKVVRGWLYRLKIKRELKALLKAKDMDYLLMSQEQYIRYKAVARIESAMFNWIRKKRRAKLLFYSATLIQKFVRGKFVKHRSFMQALSFDEEDFRLYFLKEQKSDFYKILNQLLKNQKVPSYLRNYKLEDLKEMIEHDHNYHMIRYPNPLTFKRHSLPLLAVCSPSFLCKVKRNEGICKLIRGGQSITNIYTRFSGMEQQKETLSKIRKILCHCSTQETYHVLPSHKSKAFPALRKKVFDNYQELLVFEPPSKEFALFLCQQIFINNADQDQENFLAFFPKLMNQISACIKIQQSYRSYLVRREQKIALQTMQFVIEPIMEATIAEAIVQRRAALCISQWWKYYKVKRRIQALSVINTYLSKIDHHTLYMDQTIYENLDYILNQQSKTLRFLEQTASFDFVSSDQTNSSLEKKQFQSKNDSLNTEGAYDEAGYHLVMQNINEFTDRFREWPFPRWMLSQIKDFEKYKMSSFNFSQFYNNHLGIIHKSSLEHSSQIKDFNEIVNPYEKKMALNYGLQFISINCCSISEAKKRALLIASLTYSLRTKTFVQLYTKQTLAEAVFLKSLYTLWKQYDLLDADEKLHELMNKSNSNGAEIQILRDKQKQQGHCGLILGEKDRYEVEGHHLMCFYKIEKEEIQGINSLKSKNERGIKRTIYVQRNDEDLQDDNQDFNQIEINIYDAKIDDTSSIAKQDSQISYLQMQNRFSFHQQKSKEPVSALKNISLRDINGSNFNNYKVFQDTGTSVPNSGKSVTAYPSTRYNKGAATVANKEHVRKSSNMEFFNMRKSSGISPSTRLPSNDQTPHNEPQTLSQSYPMINSSIKDQAKISDTQNLQLIELSRYEQEQLRQKQLAALEFERIGKKFEVAKIKQINQIMKQVVKIEQDANKEMYMRFNREEKMLMQQLIDKDKERFQQEKIRRKSEIIKQKVIREKKNDSIEFANNFSQIRNMISKQSQIGQMMRHKNILLKKNQELVKNIKSQESQIIKIKGSQSINNSQGKLRPLPSTVFDSSMIQENPFQAAQKKRIYPMTAQHSPRVKNVQTGQFSANSVFPQHFQNDSITRIRDKNQDENSHKQLDFGFNQNYKFKPQTVQNRQIHKLSFIEEHYPLNNNSALRQYQ